GTEDEEIRDSPGTRYFVGVLAPRRSVGGATAATLPQPFQEEEDEPQGEVLDGDDLALGGRDTTQDGITDLAPAQDKALIPSSFGMTFSVDLEATELAARACWLQY